MGIKGTLIKCALVKARELELIVNQATVANARAIECFLATLHSSGGDGVGPGELDRPLFSL